MKKIKSLPAGRQGFTLIEMLIVIAVIAVLAGLVLYSVTQYINKGRDATIKGKLAVLITGGELWYDRNNSSYTNFCNPNLSNAVKAVWEEIPSASEDKHCNVKDIGTAWAACARLFERSDKAYCVDSKGNQKEINNSNCTIDAINCCFVGITNCIQ